jgi:hypothetical protein
VRVGVLDRIGHRLGDRQHDVGAKLRGGPMFDGKVGGGVAEERDQLGESRVAYIE